mmetsp:Transcript_21603/g.15842  ORF Transcript_21603/g.15842 Transcript_21603/m.15842 type:complete len:104 (+) Transcript_21603:1457-1768(+)
MESLEKRKLKIEELSKECLEELCFTILPDHRTLLHYLKSNYNQLVDFLEFIKDDPDEIETKDILISDIPFIPNLNGDTPMHANSEPGDDPEGKPKNEETSVMD